MQASDTITLYHNPNCGTSRNVLAMIRAAGYEPEIVDYMQSGWTRRQLVGLFDAMNVSARDVLRIKGIPAQGLKLTDASIGDEAIIDAMLQQPVLVNRPIVVSPRGTRLCRPSEAVIPLLDGFPESFTKEDGEIVYRQQV
ncbi:MAG: arsenate reductase (glutaredoxin) [Porticoccaceae bacterium]|nr:arsenate reductase (glutaredoxin) [Porticoccaceae bacterium]